MISLQLSDKKTALGVRERVERCDLCVVDLDQCIYPRFAQTTLGALLIIRCRKKPYWRFLPQLLKGTAYIGRTRSLQLLGKDPTNCELMSAFCRVIRGLPQSLLETCARRLPDLGPQSWRATLAQISRRMSVFLLTFSIDPIARAYGEAADDGGKKIFRGWRGTPLALRDGIVKGCLFSARSLSPEAKLRALEEIVGGGDFRRPLIIGHGRDEALMADCARKMGGFSVGFSSGRKEVKGFDLSLSGDVWKKLAAVI